VRSVDELLLGNPGAAIKVALFCEDDPKRLLEPNLLLPVNPEANTLDNTQEDVPSLVEES
jgi:hypothetical protein